MNKQQCFRGYQDRDIRRIAERISVKFRHPRCLEMKDLVQEALIRVYEAFKKKKTLTRKEINEISKNAIINALKRYSRGESCISVEKLSRIPSENYYGIETVHHIREAMEALPENLLDIVRVASLEDATISEIAERMGITRQTASKHLKEAKKTIVKTMARKHPMVMM
jgi:RNA polymerase sigma factor (sigma-70 family)